MKNILLLDLLVVSCIFGISRTRAQLDSMECCKSISNVTFPNSADLNTSDNRRMSLLCSLDSADVPNFDMGFLQQGQSDKYLLSIFLRAPVKQSVVEELWVANRNQPVGINATMRFIVGQGLFVMDEHGKQVWSTNVSERNPVGFRLNCLTGNLMMFDGLNKTVWQSFDHPTDTLVQGQKMTYNMKLVSRVSASDPSEGSYSLVMEPGGLALYDELHQPYWVLAKSGSNDTQSVSRTCSNLTTAEIFDMGFMLLYESSQPAIPALTSSLLCGDQTDLNVRFSSWPGANRTRFMKLDDQGNLRVYDWNSGSKVVDYDVLGSTCAVSDSCGQFGLCQNNGQCSCQAASSFQPRNASDTSQGCLPPASGNESTCRSIRGAANGMDMMELMPGLTYPSNRYSYLNQTLSLEECKSNCLNNCSCRVAFYENNSRHCFLHGKEFKSFQGTPDTSFLAFIKASKEQSDNTKSTRARNIGIGVSVTALFACLVLTWLIYRKKQKSKPLDSDEEAFLDSLPGLPPRYSIKALEGATDGFSRKLGHGGFGTVYLGSLSNGMRVAVKKLDSAHQGKKEFRAEVATIGSIHHINLVRLRGFCTEGSNRLLVYEYMSNGSLDKWLFGSKVVNSNEVLQQLDWSMRFNIALGTARGLAYLHEQCKERILHLDVKPQNILLDEKFCPKVSDFGLAKLMGGEDTHVFTTMRGTPGYLAPEWLSGGISEKSDVYSYGIVLLELVSGRHSYSPSAGNAPLPSWASSKLEEGKVLEVVESSIQHELTESDRKQAEIVIYTALWCIQVDPALRPSMSTVVLILEGLLEAERPPPISRLESLPESAPRELLDLISSQVPTTSSSVFSAISSSESESRPLSAR